MPLYAGLISGTSMDGVEAVLLEVDIGLFQVRAAVHTDYPPALTQRLRAAIEAPQRFGLDDLGELDVQVGHVFADSALQLLAFAGFKATDVRAIGSHGQTILHRPRTALPFTLQVGDPNIIAERSGIDVVADFRRRDIAAGGEAAPLAPGFHAAVFAAADEVRVVVNIGGISNITVLAPGKPVTGFDTGPGNCLMDLWARQELGEPFDRDGAFAASGRCDHALLQALLAEPYLALPAPKSTGRELFHMPWLQAALGARALAPADVQATLCEYTAVTLRDAIVGLAGVTPERLLVCGGGAYNAQLLSRLAANLPHTRVASTAFFGIAPEHVEGALFAWLAHRHLEGQSGNLPAVTGARGPRILGALFPGAVITP